jgi:hypothetical protein
MLLNVQTFALAALFSAVATGRPLDASKPSDVVLRSKGYAVVNVGGEPSKPRDIIPRKDKSYAVVNVGGEPTSKAPPPATSIINTTKTVEVVSPGATVTQEVTTTVEPAPAPAPTQSTSCTSSTLKTPSPSSPAAESSVPASSSEPISPTPTPTSEPMSPPVISVPAVTSQVPAKETPKPIFVTVTVSTDDGPTSFYDDGMWHTYYRIKTFEAAAAATAS